MVVEYGWSEDERRYENVLYRTQANALSKLGIARLEPPKHVDDVAARWINGTNAEQIASNVGRRWVDGFGTGMVQLGFVSKYAHPELEVGDMVGVMTRDFAAVDPNTSNAVKGKLWVAGVIVEVGDVLGKSFVIWVRSYADIMSAPTSGTIDVGFRRYRSKVYMSAYMSADVTIENVTGYSPTVPFDTEAQDEGDLHDTTTNTGRMTIPAGGKGRYRLAANVEFSGLNLGLYARLYKGGAVANVLAQQAVYSGDATNGSLLLTAEDDAVEGDWYVLQAAPDPPGSSTILVVGGDEEETHFTITRIGA
jgi:hypothetical protein